MIFIKLSCGTGNEVTADRKTKIRNAVVAVDADKSGDLDFPEFIQFMKVMDKFNKGIEHMNCCCFCFCFVFVFIYRCVGSRSIFVFIPIDS